MVIVIFYIKSENYWIFENIKPIRKIDKTCFKSLTIWAEQSPRWGILQSDGDVTIYLVQDFQNLKEMISAFINERGKRYLVALSVKPESESYLLLLVSRVAYCQIMPAISEIPKTENTSSFAVNVNK